MNITAKVFYSMKRPKCDENYLSSGNSFPFCSDAPLGELFSSEKTGD